MNKKMLGITVAFATVGAVGVAASSALAYRGDPSATGPNCTTEQHEAIETALESNDYAAWKELMQGRGRVTQVVTEENFAKFAEAHALEEAGKTAEAAAIRQELGLGQGAGANHGMGRFGNQ